MSVVDHNDTLRGMAKLIFTIVQRSLIGGIAISLVITLFITGWELIENPGGVFRPGNGLHWGNIRETAWSWFYPTFVTATIGMLIVFICLALLQHIRTPRS